MELYERGNQATAGLLNYNEEPLYDDLAISASLPAGHSETLFLSGVTPGGKTLLDTNVKTGGQIPWPQFTVRALSVGVVARGLVLPTPSEVQDLLMATTFNIKVDYKDHYLVPSFIIPSGYGLVTNDTATPMATNQMAYASNLMSIPGVGLEQGKNQLEVDLKFWNGTTVISNDRTLYLYVFLHGKGGKRVN